MNSPSPTMEVQPRRTWRFRLSDLYCVTDEDAAQIAVETVGKRDVDDAIDAAKGDGGLGAVACKRPQASPWPPASSTPMAFRMFPTDMDAPPQKQRRCKRTHSNSNGIAAHPAKNA